jgi:transposase
MAKRFRECTLDQPYLLPPSLQDWLPEDHLARFFAQVAAELDLSEIYGRYERKDGRGLAAYHPLMMTRLLLYGYVTGKRSSRQIEKATYEEVPFRYLAADQHPDHDTIANFRKEHLAVLARLFTQALRMCQRAGMVKLKHVAMDGTKISANASRESSRSYEQLEEEERRLGQLVNQLLADAEAVDQAEDAQYGEGRGDELPEELNTAEKQRARIRAAKAALEAEAREHAAEAERERQEAGGKPRNSAERKRWQRASATPQTEKRGNLVDPDSRMMKESGRPAFLQGYNAQIAVDGEWQVVVAATVTQRPQDRRQLLPLAQAVRRNVGRKPKLISADAGYWSTEALEHPALKNIRLLVPPDGAVARHDSPNRPSNSLARSMRHKLRLRKGRMDYSRRKAIVEPVFGYWKERWNFRRFLLRGLENVTAEWLLHCTTHNLRKLFLCRKAQAAFQTA